jgi:hypothetical protein
VATIDSAEAEHTESYRNQTNRYCKIVAYFLHNSNVYLPFASRVHGALQRRSQGDQHERYRRPTIRAWSSPELSTAGD